MSQAANSLLSTSVYNFDKAAERLGLEAGIKRRLLGPKEKIELDINPILPCGKLINAKVFVVRHHDALGPAKGGIRMTPTVTLDDVCGLAMEMTWKTSLIGVPFGGGKSGIRLDPSKLSETDKEVVVRAFARGASHHIGPEWYVPAPDMGTNEMDMAHIRDCISYSQGVSITRGCFVTGKPVILGGIVGRREATGKGVVYTVAALCERIGRNLEGLRVAVQGFGNVGSVAAAEIGRLGAKVVGISDIGGGIVNDKGIDVQSLVGYAKETGSIQGFEGCADVDRDDILEIPCDVLIPAAAQSQIRSDNVDKIAADIIAEGANAPITPEADEVLKEKGVRIIPDILCNAGGVFVSYLEYTQETQRDQWTLREVEGRLRDRMSERFNEVYDYSREKNLSMREAAMDLAVGHVAEGVYARGLLP
ncbi:Glutamate dehydrogenase [Anaerohalosphaera lusitana]|uniref:Glutamate dehydrogenase n=1 Tax=Anaerohalosphaera lusitana TaxID=1936003 RepID=A0A1U9NM37_9BACT|nr:Glu/Leu/Phe/Val dehydrogenase [Anaerohalosphaera lusitana]AQT68566.1 Glutamate dehydrogenase [Anaerohalosphaera lusitana]